MASTLDDFVNTGKKLGLEGSDLLEFAEKKKKEQDDLERERRLQEREEKKIELEERRLERELEDRKREQEQEREEKKREQEKKIELEERRLEREHELEIRRLDAQAAASRSSHSSVGPNPKLPFFTDKEDIDNYLYRFEIHAEAVGWRKDRWASCLASHLQGKSLEYFRSIPRENIANYDEVKKWLLRRFSKTEENLHRRFRTCVPEQSEDFGAYIARLQSLFSRWLELANIDNSFDKLCDLVLREHVMKVCHRDLVSFIKERDPHSLPELVASVNTYRAAHPSKPIPGNFVAESLSLAGVTENKIQIRSDRVSRPQFRGRGRGFFTSGRDSDRFGNNSGNSFRGHNHRRAVSQPRSFKQQIRCFNCERPGHIAKDCQFRSSSRQAPLVCHSCGETGHFARACRKSQVASFASSLPDSCNAQVDCPECDKLRQIGNSVTLTCGHHLPVMSVKHTSGRLSLYDGLVGTQEVKVLRDTGATCVGVAKHLVGSHQYTGETIRCILFTGTAVQLPVAEISVCTPYLSGTVLACVLDAPPADLIIGNVSGVRDCSPYELADWRLPNTTLSVDSSVSTMSEDVAAVVTRAQSKKVQNPLPKLPVSVPCSTSDLQNMQRTDVSLSSAWYRLNAKTESKFPKAKATYILTNDLLYRKYVRTDSNEEVLQLVLPASLRPPILKLCHDSIVGAHLGVARTLQRVLKNFYWPTVVKDVKTYCKSCDRCQRTVQKGKVRNVLVRSIPSISTPMAKASIDIIGPFSPPTDRGHRYVLTFVDHATRWPEAIPLKNITTVTVAEALFEIFSRLGCCQSILSDQGQQFMSEVMTELLRLLGIKTIHSTPYHAQSNGMVERLNGTLKQMLRRVAADSPKNWDRYLPAVLWAYREVRNESTTFSPFQLLFGRSPVSPSDVFHRLLVIRESEQDFAEPVTDYVISLQERLESSLKLAHSYARKHLDRGLKYKNTGRSDRSFPEGSKVLLLLPTSAKKLLLSWKGPYDVIRKISDVDYVIDVDGVSKTFHVNMCKLYIERPEVLLAFNTHVDPYFSSTGLVSDDVSDDSSVHSQTPDLSVDKLVPQLTRTQGVDDVHVSQKLSDVQRDEVKSVLRDFHEVFSDVPGKTNTLSHEIRLTSESPIRLRPYAIPHSLVDKFEKEVKSMLDLGVIEASTSPYSSPVVLVKKPDSSIRFCIDFRRLNKITVFDAEPMPNADDLIASVGLSTYFTKLDLTKGYWQIPMDVDSKEFTAFQTPLGLFQWNFMPFGLCNAPATFTRLMRIVLRGLKCVIFYIDDVVIHSRTWSEHVNDLRTVLSCIHHHGLTIKPSKADIGCEEVVFLGHVVGNGVKRPDAPKVEKLLSLKAPTNKKEVRSLIGLVNYYRNFVPNFSSLSATFSDLTRKGQPDKIVWSGECEHAFDTLKQCLSSSPVLVLPDFSKLFFLRTDASSRAVGGCLLQERDDVLRPVSYCGRKLLDREMNYPTIEREALAIVFAVGKFRQYLFGTNFVIQTDHKPLSILQAKPCPSGRLSRWALFLQEFQFQVQYISGSDNCLADSLSRLV